jgi:cysteinyl-tRNA synthetase
MKLYNTLTRQVDTIEPLNPPKVTVYTCGPTVYDYAHIGHWFNYVRMDTLIRALKINGLQPTWVMNITDVGHLVSDADEGEDKLEKGARREGKTAWEVAKFYTEDFLQGMQTLGITRPDFIPRATEHIAEQIELIKQLESKGYTYVISDGVYYDTSKFEGYAAFARLDLDSLHAGARVEYNREKRNPSDFALWKFSPKDQQRDMEWESPWGKGFPGWHIECSAMSMKYLGDTLDIHTGGIDHVPVHHTNEIAQSEAATGKRFANYWMHSNHLMVNGEKISKSLGNGIRLQEILKMDIPAEAIRLHILESHYRSQSKFSIESVVAAENRLRSLRAMAARRWQPSESPAAVNADQCAEAQEAIKQALSDDLDTPTSLLVLSKLERAIDTSGISISAQGALSELLAWLDEALGLNLAQVPDISDEQKQRITERQQAREAKDWQKSDELRDQLLAQHISVRDTDSGPVWAWR